MHTPIRLVLFATLIVSGYSQATAETAKGTVFHDTNGNAQLDNGEKGIPGVYISNGEKVAPTDKNGKYKIQVNDDTTIFVLKPSGWRPVQDKNGISRFYYTHKPEGSPDDRFSFPGVAPTGSLPKEINFPLYPQEEPDTFKMVCFGDTQPRNQAEVDYIAHDVVEELIGFDASFGITLGDVVFNDLGMLEPLERLIATIGMPWYNIHGNHDTNQKAENDIYSDETWERLYGPTYYSFDYGQVHFVTLDNIAWDGKRKYHGELGSKQLTFLKNDLARVPNDKLVVLLMHIPIISMTDKEAVYNILDNHPNTFTLSAHWHRQAHFFLDNEDGWKGKDEHHHLVHATVCGSWWSGAKDETGIPHATMADGAPNGYSIITFDKQDYSIRFKAARRPADHQMTIYTPEVISPSDAANTKVIVNVFAGSERSTVEMRLGDSGPWTPLDLTPMIDPYYAELKKLEPLLPKEAGRTLPDASKSTHIWSAPLPANPKPGLHLINVRTTDMFGQTYTDSRSIRIE